VKRKPKKVLCHECGAEVMSFKPRALCDECIRAMGKSVCRCSFPDWEPLVCPLHWGRNPYDIPF
jgi:predicted amidophosphoribosyltransferase